MRKEKTQKADAESLDEQQPSRRSFLVASASGLSAAWLATRWSGILAAEAYARQATHSEQPVKFVFFSPQDAVEIESVIAQIIPSDDSPGAREAGTIYFVDHALSTFDRDQQPHYTQGLQDLTKTTREIFPEAAKFSALTRAQQIKVLTAIEETPFFTSVRQHTVVGFLADPIHGGNRDGIGWKLIGFDGTFDYKPPFGYYDRNYKQGE